MQNRKLLFKYRVFLGFFLFRGVPPIGSFTTMYRSVRVGVNIGILFRAAKELFYKQKHQALLKKIKDK